MNRRLVPSAILALLAAASGLERPPAAGASSGGAYVSIERRFRAFAPAEPAASLGTIRRAGDYAVADARATREGSPFRGQLLFRRYVFGWQIVGFQSPRLDACALASRGVPAPAVRVLTASSGARAALARCGTSVRRYPEAAADASAVAHVLVTRYPTQAADAAIDGDYALAGWGFNGGGSAVLKKTHDSWRVLTGGGGQIDACDLVRAGVPRGIAHRMLLRAFPNGADRTIADVSRCP